MVLINIEELLKKKGKSKYWLANKMEVRAEKLNNIIFRETKSISFKYIELLCKYLECTPGELITVTFDDTEKVRE